MLETLNHYIKKLKKIIYVLKKNIFSIMSTTASTNNVNLTTGVNTILQTYLENIFQEFVSKLSEKYKDISITDCIDIFNNIDKNIQIKISFKQKKTKKSELKNTTETATELSTSSDSETDSVNNKTGCPYIISKGKSAGSVCGMKSKSNTKFCKRHEKFEHSERKTKKILPVSKPTDASQDKTDDGDVPKPVNKPKLIIRKNPRIDDRLWHRETQMVFKSATEKYVIGRCEHDTVVPLSETDIATCKKWGFRFKVEHRDEEKIEDRNDMNNSDFEKKTLGDDDEDKQKKKKSEDVEDVEDVDEEDKKKTDKKKKKTDKKKNDKKKKKTEDIDEDKKTDKKKKKTDEVDEEDKKTDEVDEEDK